MKNQLIRLSASMLATLFMIASGCKKETNESTVAPNEPGVTEVRMTDGPGDFDKCMVDIQEVWINFEGKGWIQVPMTRKGMYNILEFNNGKDTLIATARLTPAKIKQVKLILGSENKITIDGTVYEIEDEDIEKSKLVIDVNEEMVVDAHGKYIIYIDIDAGHSFFYYLGRWFFKPHMRYFFFTHSGSVTGDVNPDNAAYYAYVVPTKNLYDTIGTYLRSDGTFKIWGLREGYYHLGLTNKAGAIVKSADSISVKVAQNTDLGAIDIP